MPTLVLHLHHFLIGAHSHHKSVTHFWTVDRRLCCEVFVSVLLHLYLAIWGMGTSLKPPVCSPYIKHWTKHQQVCYIPPLRPFAPSASFIIDQLPSHLHSFIGPSLTASLVCWLKVFVWSTQLTVVACIYQLLCMCSVQYQVKVCLNHSHSLNMETQILAFTCNMSSFHY